MQALALDLKSDTGLRSGTVAYGRELKRWDQAKKYGAETVRDRDRKWAQPDGIRIGNYFIFPSVETRYEFDDNVFVTAGQKKADHAIQVLPKVMFRSQFARHVADFEFGGRAKKFATHDELDFITAYGAFDGALHINQAHTLSLSVFSGLETEDRLQTGSNFDAIEKTKIWRNRASIGLTRDAGRGYLKWGAAFESWDFRDVRGRNGTMIDQDARDLKIFSSDLKLGYRFSPGFNVEAKLRGLRRLHRGDAILKSDAWGYEIIGGLKWETSPLLRWQFTAGYGIRDYDDPNLRTSGIGLVEARATWLPLRALTIYGTVRRSYDDGISASGTTGKVDDKIEIAADYEALRNVIFTIRGNYTKSEFENSSRRDQLIIGNFQVHYLMSKNWKITFDYEYAERLSNEIGQDLRRNRFWIGAKYQF
ncbi:MAG: outer membrane beta-barrel protein [Hyphomicrobiaceae bacterium]|nr:outer membrane beta-barrel protein [Hyphomicrobiaceae bacterium]